MRNCVSFNLSFSSVQLFVIPKGQLETIQNRISFAAAFLLLMRMIKGEEDTLYLDRVRFFILHKPIQKR